MKIIHPVKSVMMKQKWGDKMKGFTKFVGSSLIAFSLLVTGCSKESSNEKTDDNTGEKATELTVAFYIHTAPPADLELVEEEISKYTKEKINATIDLVPISLGQYEQQTNLMLSSNEKLDALVVSSRMGYNSQVNKGQLLPLDELLDEHGKDIKESLDPDYLEATKFDGEIYGIPTIRDFAGAPSVNIRSDLLDKYGIHSESIKTLNDIGTAFKTIKQNESDISPLVSANPGVEPTQLYSWFDPLGDWLGVLPNYDNNLKVVNLYETKEYEDFVKLMREWYNDGLILKDAATSKEPGVNYIKSNRGIAYYGPSKPGVEQQESQKTGMDMKSITLGEPATTTSNVTGVMWGIPLNAEMPDKSMQFINLMYSDETLINLLNWGIEGKHYVKVEDNVIDYAPGVDAKTSGWNLGVGYLWGNQFKSYVFKGIDADIWNRMEEFNKSAKKSKALGFAFDNSTVKNEVSAVNNVINEYAMGLEYGTLDPDKSLPEFIEKLKASGIDKIIEEKQKQLDSWVESK
jgi:putative aldouronate transport system substrate-binding protein